jgi:hypothetical protein
MTHQDDNTAIGQMLEAVITPGMDGLETAISILKSGNPRHYLAQLLFS